MANFSQVKAGIKAIVAADADLSAADQVFDYAPNIASVTADPFAVIEASGNESEFETTTENKRRYGFTIQIFAQRNNQRENAAEALLTGIVDRILDALDQNTTLGVAGVLMTTAAPSAWGYVLGDKEYRMAEIRLSTMVSVDVS